MSTKIVHLLIFLLCLSNLHMLKASPWIKAAYYDYSSKLPVSDVKSALFTHLYFAFAQINSSNYQLSFSSEAQQILPTFTSTIRRNNPSITSLLSIGLAYGNYSTFSKMATQPSYRKSFILSSIKTARQYGLDGLELSWNWPTSFDMKNIGTLLDEWRAALNSESTNSRNPQLLLTMVIYHLPDIGNASYPVESIKRNLNWTNMLAFDYHLPKKENVIGNHAALYDPSGSVTSDFSIRAWLKKGLPQSKLVMGLPYHGYAWTLVNPNENSIGSPASGSFIGRDGSMGYLMIKSFISDYGHGVSPTYNATYVANYFTIGTLWINFDDAEAIMTKVAYAKTNGLLGYFVFQLANDDDWRLSQAAYEVGEEKHEKKGGFWVPVLVPIASVILLLLIFSTYRIIISKGKTNLGNLPSSEAEQSIAFMNDNPYQNAPNIQVFTVAEIEAATNNFAGENKLGEGGYGPVYKGKLPRGQEIAVKRLSKTSHQGVKEFRNEFQLAAKLQHVNLVRILGFCTEKKENILIYEYMPNKSLDYYLFDQTRRLELNWEKRVHIIEGIAQGLLYLQEYSNVTVIHKEIKASNILLDDKMTPKISDFGMARIFHKGKTEASTGQIVGTYGYVPPEYVKRGVYSMKYDVYSFGVLLLQIISAKKNACFYGPYENLNLLEYAYELWKTGNGEELMDPTLDESSTALKLMRCLQIALLCVQESAIDRPLMLEVYSMLKIGNDAIIASPKTPAFSAKSSDENECFTSEVRFNQQYNSFTNVSQIN